jgi:hypothetical protein
MDYEAISAKMFPEHDPAYGARLVQAVCEAAGVPEMERRLEAAEKVCLTVRRQQKAIEALGGCMSEYDDDYETADKEWVEAEQALEQALHEWEAVRG